MRVAKEMGRLIRLSYNGHLPAEELTKYVFALDKLRACLESAISIEANAIANAPPPPPGDVTINVLTIPEGRFLTPEQMATGYDWGKEMAAAETVIETELIEHMPPAKPEPVAEPEPEPIAAPVQPELDPVMKRAMEMGYKPLPPRIRLVE